MISSLVSGPVERCGPGIFKRFAVGYSQLIRRHTQFNSVAAMNQPGSCEIVQGWVVLPAMNKAELEDHRFWGGFKACPQRSPGMIRQQRCLFWALVRLHALYCLANGDVTL